MGSVPDLVSCLAQQAGLLAARRADQVAPIEPEDAGHQAKIPVSSQVNDVVGWWHVGPHHGEATGLHGGEIELYPETLGKGRAILTAPKRSVRDAPEPKGCPSKSKLFSVRRDPRHSVDSPAGGQKIAGRALYVCKR